MGFFDTLSQLGSSAIDLINSAAVKADETTRKKVKKMTNEELLSLSDKNPNNKYVKEERNNRGI